MYKAILASVIALGILIPTATVNAKPTDTEQTTPKKKKHTKKRVKKQPAVQVEDKFNAFLKECGLFGCSSGTYGTFVAPMNSEMSSGQYFAQEYEREQNKKKQLAKASKIPVTVPVKEEKPCGFFERCNKTLTVYEEAKRWEGKTATGNKQELKALLAQGNNNVPVDPNKIPWCAAFANAILNREGYSTTGSLAARSFLTLVHKTKDPEVGDIVITKRGRSNATGHVGFFEGFEEIDGVKYVKVFGGNTQKSVSTGWFPVTAVLGYRKIA
jgi:uncharacterized protein (TIGR02594 family)